MLIFKRISDLEDYIKKAKKQGLSIGFVPTMGALHPGHIALIETCKTHCKLTVCSIFVNPTQFNDKSDFEKYPVTISNDIKLLSHAGCDVLFLPSVMEIYPNGLEQKKPAYRTGRRFNFGLIANILEGSFRPGHFDGMAQVVARLLKIVKPHQLFMGQKDYQQQLIVGLLIKKIKLNTRLVMCPTVREKDGLAMSSRNTRLDATSRKLAVQISKTLKYAKAQLKNTKAETGVIQQKSLKRLAGFEGIETEYFEIRNAKTLEVPKRRSEKLIALTAVKIGGVRLIDNMALN
jgi:pantoate--beta-alanine ligase